MHTSQPLATTSPIHRSRRSLLASASALALPWLGLSGAHAQDGPPSSEWVGGHHACRGFGTTAEACVPVP